MSAVSSTNAAPVKTALAPPPCRPAPSDAALAGLVPFSSVDWPGRFSAVLFLAGCPWRCGYCHNAHLQRRHGLYRWEEVREWLRGRQGLLDAVVFSGGEPLSEPQLAAMAAEARAMGFAVGLHSAGIYPTRLETLLPHLDWVGLDIKTDRDGYDELTRRHGSADRVERSLELLLASGREFECRTTWSPDLLDEAALLRLAAGLSERGVRHYAVQRCRSDPGGPPVAGLGRETLERLAGWFERFDYR